jgi:hypothetical protein
MIKRKHSNTVLLSLLLHLAIVYVAVLSSDLPQRKKAVDDVIINSYFIAKKIHTENIDVDESPLSTMPETVEETSPKAINGNAIKEKTSVKITKSPVNRPDQLSTVVKKLQESNIRKNENLLSQKHLSSTGLPVSTIDLLHKDAYEAMLKQETESFNKLKNSPIIDTIGTLDTTKRPEPNQPNIVYCDGAGSKTIVALSKFTGGNVQCKALEIQSFIDKRLTKNAEQP